MRITTGPVPSGASAGWGAAVLQLGRAFLLLACAAVCAQAVAQAPADSGSARYYGDIAIGPRLVRAVLLSYSEDDEAVGSKLLFSSQQAIQLVSEGQTQLGVAGIAEAARTVAAEYKKLQALAAEKGLAHVDYHVVAASAISGAANHDALAQAVQQAAGLPLTFIDAEQESYYTLLSAIPPARRAVGVSVNIGRDATTTACLARGSTRRGRIDFGTLTLRKAAGDRAHGTQEPAYSQAVMAIIDEQVKPGLSDCALERGTIYWSGGVAQLVAAFTHPEGVLQPYVQLSSDDVDAFLAQLKAGTWNQHEPEGHFPPKVGAAQREAILKAAAEERRSLTDRFPAEDLLAGVSLMKVIYEGQRQAERQYYARSGNYLFGYALDRFRADSSPESAIGPVPRRVSYFAGVDLGSRGIKASLYSFSSDGVNVVPRVLFKDEVETRLTSSAKGNLFIPEGIEEARAAVVKLVGEMREAAAREHIEPRYYLLGSSGVAAYQNRDALKRAVDTSLAPLQLQFIDVATEGIDALASAVPPSRLQDSIVADIGSGNTKLGCMIRDQFTAAEIPYGSVKLRKAVPEGQDYAAGLRAVLAKVGDDYHATATNTPCLRNRPFIYLVGGASWATATFIKPEEQRAGYVPLTLQDVDSFLEQLGSGQWNQTEPQFHFAAKMDSASRDAITKENLDARRDVQGVFAREDLLAGVSLVRLVLAEGNHAARVYFARNGNYLYGHALREFKNIDMAPEAAAGGAGH